MTAEARERFLGFALTAPWPGNFRDLASAVTRLATLAEAGRVLYAESLAQLAKPNFSDRVRKYLAKFDLDYVSIKTQRDKEYL